MRFEPGSVRFHPRLYTCFPLANLRLPGFQSNVVRTERRHHPWRRQQIFRHPSARPHEWGVDRLPPLHCDQKWRRSLQLRVRQTVYLGRLPCQNVQLLNPKQAHFDVRKARVPEERRQAPSSWHRLRKGPTGGQTAERARTQVRSDLHGDESRRAHLGGVEGQLLEACDR